MNNEHLFKFSELVSNPVERSIKKSSNSSAKVTTRKNIRKVFGNDDPDKVEKVYLDKADKIVYVDASTSPVAVLLPTKFDSSSELTIKRLYTSNFNVYVEAQNGQTIEGEEIIGLVSNDEGSSFIVLRYFEGNWHILG